MSSLELDQLRLLVVVDNETDTLSSVDEGVPQIPEMAHHLARVPATRTTPDGHSCHETYQHLCVACHGFSVLVTGRRGAERRTILFDVGPSASVWRDNAARLGIDLASIEAIFLSHWHFDHSGALPEVAAAVMAARRKAGLGEPVIVDVHPDRPDQRGILVGADKMVLLPAEPTLTALEASGARVTTHADAQELCDGFFFGSGAIPRVTEYETGLAGHYSFRGDQCEPDPLILDELFLAASIRDRGVSVLSACSHAGIVNVGVAARKAFGNADIDVLLGGYHLSGKLMEQRITPTLRDLAALVRPRLVAPGHCTGWRAKAALATAFAPGRYGPSVVGSTYLLGPPAS
jgi:7,8-dihydropterin-6-yl-methyl-4-(beta-D-ribofuranosyl)aminobenzene 5'-phosphate synthase